MIELKGLCKSFEEKEVLKDINATFENGKTNLIIGQSGSGKTVLMKCIVGLLTPDKGELLYDHRNFLAMGKKEKKALRREMGMIFQSAFSTFAGSFIPSTSPIRLVSRIQWVSVTIAGLPKTSPIMRLALFLPTPGSSSSLSKSSSEVISLFSCIALSILNCLSKI